MALQSLFMVVFGATIPVTQISDFPERCSRSSKGSLHVKPSSTVKLTQGEVEHIKAKHPLIAKGMKVVKKITPPAPEGEPPKAADQTTAKADPATTPPPEGGLTQTADKAAPNDTPSGALGAPSASDRVPRGKDKGRPPGGSSGSSEG